MTAQRDRERLQRIAAVVSAADASDPARAICDACVAALPVAGASIVLTAGGIPTALASSDAVAARIEELQATLGEGPCADACESGRPVGEPDLAAPRRARWVAFAPAALAAGAAAVFALPVRIGAVRLGALTFYRSRAGDLSDEQHVDARLMADVVAHVVLAIQAQAAPGTLGPALEPLVGHRAVVHQASGMVSVQLGVGVGEALVRLRAHAFAAGRELGDVAADVVARRLRLG
ncbi:MAG: GAF and ANTAR domain-containing protein [Thermoleophilia bacterium]|nr:GAF and ANTAR domain-containing protein [Thermoleophilia bacterium]